MRTRNHRAGPTPRPHIAALALATLVALFIVPATFAGWLSPNVNNNAQDNFGDPIYTGACNKSYADYVEIRNAWIANDGANLYFKVEACATTTNYSAVRYVGGLDCNSDGDVDDGDTATTYGDRRVVYVPAAGGGGDQVNLVDGKNNLLYQLPDNNYGERIGSTALFEWMMPLQYIYPECRASIAPIPMGVGTGLTNKYPPTQDQTPQVSWSIPIDYGDAINPNPETRTCEQFPTRIACDGARHGTAGALRLGALLDPDTGGVHTANADGDDLANLPDEDGVAPTAGVNWVNGGQGSLTAAVAGGSGYLNCWIDWNNDKDWADADEKVVNAAPVAAGANTLAISVPAAAAPFPTSYIARCRLSPASGQGTSVTGAVEFGEVEDHKWAFGATGNRPAPVTLAASVLDPATVRLSWTNIPANEGYLVLSSAAPYFQPGDAGVTVTPASGSPYDVTGVLGPPADARFYAVQGQVTSSDPDLTSALSNRVGIFEFALVAGS